MVVILLRQRFVRGNADVMEPQFRHNEKEIIHGRCVVANTLESLRDGAVGVIDWLDEESVHTAKMPRSYSVCPKNCRAASIVCA